MSTQETKITCNLLLDQSTVILGASKTGKSTIVVDMLYQMRGKADQIIVFSPTDRQNHTYDNGVVPIPCIHYTINLKLLEDIWARQEAMMDTYSRANKPSTLSNLFAKIPGIPEAHASIAGITNKMAEYQDKAQEEGKPPSVLKKMEDECNKLLIMIHKQYIMRNSDRLFAMRLSSDEQFALKYIDFNPRIILIFDDCTDLLKEFKNKKVIAKLFYQNRHNLITLIIAAHTVKVIDDALMKSANNIVYTSAMSVRESYGRKSANISKEESITADAAVRATFSPLTPHQKLVYIRDHDKLFRFTADCHESFRFGSNILWEYCKRIQAEEGSRLLTGNKFASAFV